MSVLHLIAKYFEPGLFESLQITKFQYLSENYGGVKNESELSSARYISGCSRESGKCPP
jgi:hypothetical protein